MSQLPVSHNKERTIPRPQSLTASIEAWGNFTSGVYAPPVDRDLVTKFANNELKGKERQLVIELVGSFRAWRDVLNEVVKDRPRG